MQTEVINFISEVIFMNDNSKVKFFISQLRKFLPEKTIYLSLSSLPEDIFDNQDYISIPCLKSDDEIQEFIKDNGFEDPQNIINFFMEQYFARIDEMLKDIFEEMEKPDESMVYNVNYNRVNAG